MAKGAIDWDDELIKILPKFLKVSNIKERNEIIISWLRQLDSFETYSAGKNKLSNMDIPIKLKPSFAWIKDGQLSNDIVKYLSSLNNFHTKDHSYYITSIQSDGINFIRFSNEKSYPKFSFSKPYFSLLGLFRFWNVINYWYPYKYDLNWDAVLIKFIPEFLNIKSKLGYNILIQQLLVALNDSHGYLKSNDIDEIKGSYYLPFTVKAVSNDVIVTDKINDSLFNSSGLQLGDCILSINGENIKTIITNLRNYIPASNYASFLNFLSYWLVRTDKTDNLIKVKRGNEELKLEINSFKPFLFTQPKLNLPFFAYPKDSSLCVIDSNIGYINIGKFKKNDSAQLSRLITNSKSLIIDLRQNQNESNGTGGGNIVAQYILPPQKDFVKFSYADPTFPGLFVYSQPTNMGVQSVNNFFKGKIVVLINENTLSLGEFLAMAYKANPQTVTLGTQTGGADGNMTYLTLPGNITVSFTGLGVYFPDGRETQRVGIKPDIEVKLSIQDYKSKFDRQLNEAVKYLQKY